MGVDPAVEFIASIGIEPIVEPDAPARFDLSRACRRWIEDLPRAIVELDFDPAMGMGGADENIKGEFAANGVENPLSHERGVISMARSRKYDSASSQFFICHADAKYLDGQYAAFGKVIEGMDVVDAIAETKTDANDRPKTEQKIKSVRVLEEN